MRRIAIPAVMPDFESRNAGGPSVLVWTGRRDTALATIALMGLESFDGDVAYVGDAPLPNVVGRFVPRGDAAIAEALRSAGCIVCVDPADPADAAAVARKNVPIVAPLTSRAHEVAEGIVVWDAADAAALPRAVAAALARTS